MLSPASITSTGTVPTQQKNQYIGPNVDWDQCIQNKPKWIHTRLQDVEFFTEDGHYDEQRIKDAMEKEKHLILVTDGSKKYIHMMSFGWVLATSSGTWLAASKGPGSGEGSSLRAEAEGMLSGALCCGIIADEICNPDFQITYICDNNELIRNCEDRLTYNIPFPNTTLRPKFDLIEEIYQVNKKHEIRPSFQWIKGHQDDLQEYDDLTFEAILNIAADKRAKEFNNEKGRIQLDPEEDMVPSNTAALIIQGSMVSSNYYDRLVETYSELRYMTYLQRRFAWNDDTLRSIAWKSFKNAIANIDRTVVITKLTNRILAVNYIQKRRKHRVSAKCKHCNKIETVSHLYHCNIESRIQWRLSYITTLRKKMKEIKTDESLIDAMATILTEYLDSGQVSKEKYHQRFHEAIDSQNTIGFEHFFLGKISQKWLDLHLPHLPPDPNLSSRYTWGRHIVETTMKKMIDLWEIRNKEIHGNDEKEIEVIRKQRMTDEINQYFALRQKCCVVDRSLFPDDTNAFIEKNNSRSLSDWILGNKGWITASIQRKKDGDLGSCPILPWIATKKTNDKAKIKKVRENRRRRIIIEEERADKKKAERKRKREAKKLKFDPKSKEPTVKHHFTTKKTNPKTKHTAKKHLENEPRQKKRRRKNETKTKQTKLMPYILQSLKNLKDKIVSSVRSHVG